MDDNDIRRSESPYKVERTPRGCVVFCEEHLIADELKLGEAHALALSLNLEYQTRMLLK